MSLELSKPGILLLVLATLFVTMTLRYVVITGSAYLAFWKFLRDRLQHRRIQRKFPPRRRVQREFAWSLSTFAIFSVTVASLLAMSKAGWTRHYENIAERGWGYWALSIALMLLVHDAYFYWAHRLLHVKKIFRLFHRVHHQSFNPSPWAVYAFHPVEAMIQAAAVYVIAFTIPFHMSALYVALVLMSITGTVTHLGYEILPRGVARHPLGRWLCTSVHHNMHHHHGHDNFGLYLNLWDRLMGTNHPAYEKTFEAVTARPLVSRGRSATAQSVVPVLIDGSTAGPTATS